MEKPVSAGPRPAKPLWRSQRGVENRYPNTSRAWNRMWKRVMSGVAAPGMACCPTGVNFLVHLTFHGIVGNFLAHVAFHGIVGKASPVYFIFVFTYI